MIDPGHGGTDSGAVSHGSQEKSLALDTSKRLQSYLKKTGYYTVLTRAADTGRQPLPAARSPQPI